MKELSDALKAKLEQIKVWQSDNTHKDFKEYLEQSHKIEVEGGQMMGTIAMHMLGDISREKDDYCFIGSKTNDGLFYIGAWREGYGFVSVLFPVETTREPTKAEWDYLKDKVLMIV